MKIEGESKACNITIQLTLEVHQLYCAFIRGIQTSSDKVRAKKSKIPKNNVKEIINRIAASLSETNFKMEIEYANHSQKNKPPIWSREGIIRLSSKPIPQRLLFLYIIIIQKNVQQYRCFRLCSQLRQSICRFLWRKIVKFFLSKDLQCGNLLSGKTGGSDYDIYIHIGGFQRFCNSELFFQLAFFSSFLSSFLLALG